MPSFSFDVGDIILPEATVPFGGAIVHKRAIEDFVDYDNIQQRAWKEKHPIELVYIDCQNRVGAIQK